MSGAALGASPFTTPLTLAQAQAIKSSLVDSIWSVKRQANVSVATSLGTFSFDASDDDLSNALNCSSWMPAVSALISQIGSVGGASSSVISSLVNSINTVVVNGVNSIVVGGINTDLSALVTSINSDLTNLLFDINSEMNTAASNVGNIATVTNANLSGITTEINLTIDQVNTAFGLDIPHSTYTNMGGAGFSGGVGAGVGSVVAGSAVGTIGTVSATYSGPGAPPSLTAPVMMLPVGSTTYPAFTLADQFAVVTAIHAQRANEAAARAVKQAAISALSTISDVVAYDATTGW